jgi:hypothetical protein
MLKRVMDILMEMQELKVRSDALRLELTTIQGQCSHAHQGHMIQDRVHNVICQDCCLVLSHTKEPK